MAKNQFRKGTTVNSKRHGLHVLMTMKIGGDKFPVRIPIQSRTENNDRTITLPAKPKTEVKRV